MTFSHGVINDYISAMNSGFQLFFRGVVWSEGKSEVKASVDDWAIKVSLSFTAALRSCAFLNTLTMWTAFPLVPPRNHPCCYCWAQPRLCLRRVKTWLCSSMIQSRLNHTATSDTWYRILSPSSTTLWTWATCDDAFSAFNTKPHKLLLYSWALKI